MKPNLLFFTFAILCLSNNSMAQGQSLTQIYELAKQNDRQYQSDIAQFHANKEIKAISRSGLLPQVTGTASYGSVKTESVTTPQSITSAFTDGEATTDTLSYSVSLQQAIVNFSALNTYRSGKIQAAAAEVQLAADKQNLIIRTAQAYFDVLSAVDQFTSSQAEEKALQTQLEQTRQRYEVGLISINDVHEAQAAFDSAFANRLSAETNVGIQLEALTIITGRSHDKLATLKDNFEPVAPAPNNKQDWIESAQKNNLLLQVSKLNADAAVFDAKTAKSDRYPELSGSVNYSFNDDERSGGASRQTETDRTSFSIDLTIPIYTGGNLSARERQAAQNQKIESLQIKLRPSISFLKCLLQPVI